MNTDPRPRSLSRAGSAILGIPLALFSFIFFLPTPKAAESEPASDGFAIVGARVFDGEKTWDQTTVWVENGLVRAVGTDMELPETVRRVDGHGHTLIPGLIDAHVHTWGEARSDAVRFGVTTLLDQFTSPSVLADARKDRENGGADDQADLFSAGFLATVDGGHGTQFGMPVPQVEGPDAAADWVAARKQEGSDWIKIVVEPGWGRELPTLDADTVGAVIEAAHNLDLKAVVHASTLDDALMAVDKGADGLVHIWRDREITDEQVKLLKDRGVFVIPTFVVMEGMADPTPSLELAKAPLGQGLTVEQRQSLERRFPPRASLDLTAARESVRKLAASGVRILAGSDAPNPTTAMGFSLHRELVLLTEAGLSAEQALAAATSVPAGSFGIRNRGKIATGFLADLVLISGDPTSDIGQSRHVTRVWKRGRAVDLKPKAAAPQAVDAAEAPDETLLADFEEGLKSRFGAGWLETTDQRMGGKSVVGLDATDGALAVSGELKQGSMFPWAGAMVSPGAHPMQPVDFSERSSLHFRARGDGRTYSVMVFSGDMQGIPPTQTFEPGPDWQTFTLPLESFAGADPATLRAVSFAATGRLGTFRFEIDDVEIR